MDGENSAVVPVKEREMKPPAILGWSLAPQLKRPNQKVELASLMREKEVNRLELILGAGQNALIYGGDGYGKSTLLQEYDAYLRSHNRASYFLNVLQFRSQVGLKHSIEYLEHLARLPKEERPVIMVDSADYLWEKCDPSLMEMRKQFYRFLFESDLECVFTYHLEEAKNKTTDLSAKAAFNEIIKAQPVNRIIRMQLSPDYETEKTREFLENLGFVQPLARFISELPFGRNHALLVNYFVKELEEKQYQGYLNEMYHKAQEAQHAGEVGRLARVTSYIRNIFNRYDQNRIQD